MPTITLFSVRPFPIWNVMVKAHEEFAIEERYGRMLISKGVCIEKAVHDSNVAARAERKRAEKEAAKAVESSIVPDESVTSSDEPKKRTRKGGKE